MNHSNQFNFFPYERVNGILNGSALVSGEVLNVPGNKILAIISSTFTDTMQERNAILGVILMDLRAEMESKGFEALELQFVDMRYGVRDENTLEHDTWLACSLEIERCRNVSKGTFFISLQSQKYGYQMAPKHIPRDKLDAFVVTMNEDTKLGDLACLRDDADTFRQLLEDMLTGNVTNVFERMYEVIDADVCLKQAYFFLALKAEDFGDEIGLDSIGSSLLQAKFSNSNLQQVMSIFTDDKMQEIVRRHVRFYDTVTVKEFISYWYRLDENAISPLYELRYLTDSNDPLYWKVTLPVLVYVLKDISFEPQRDADLLVARSVTEYETRIALQSEESARRCFWFHRLFAGGVTQAHDKYWDFDDTLSNLETKPKLDALTTLMRDTLTPLGRVKEYSNLTLDSLLANDTSHRVYMETFQNDFKDLLRNDIECVGKSYMSWVTDACGLGIQGKFVDEILHHVIWAKQKISTFKGREDLVEQCTALLSLKTCAAPVRACDLQCFCPNVCSMQWTDVGIAEYPGGTAYCDTCDTNISSMRPIFWHCACEIDFCESCAADRIIKSAMSISDTLILEKAKSYKYEAEKSLAAFNSLSGVSLAIVGVSGSGKTALASFISQQLKISNPKIPVIIRFCGTSTASNDAFSLMKSISLQIHFLFCSCDWQKQKLDDIKDYDALVQYFQSLLKMHALYLILDSLDQLTNNYKEQSEISFLKGVDPHPDGRIIVTTLPHDDKYQYLCSKKLDASKVSRVDVQSFVNANDPSNISAVKDITEQVLAQHGRRLVQHQWGIFEKSIMVEPSALYMHLSVYVMSAWKSFDIDSCKANVLTPTVHGIINQIFDSLEMKFGKVLLQAIIANLSLAVEGVSDMEMVDLLSIDDEVLDSVFQYSRPDIERLPYHVWLRVRTALGPLLVQREGGAFAWYHRQLKEVGLWRVEKNMQEMKRYSGILGSYYGNLIDNTIIKSRNIQTQKRFLNGFPCYSTSASINKRRCIEACHHLINAGMFEEAVEEMFNVPAIYAHCRVSYAHCFDYLKEAFKMHSHATTQNVPVTGCIIAWSDTLKHRIGQYKRFLIREMTLLASDPDKYIIACTDRQPRESLIYQDFHHYFWMGQIPSQIDKVFKFDNKLHDIGDLERITTIYRSFGGRTDKYTPLIASLEGHKKSVSTVKISCNGNLVISGGCDNTCKVWNSATGECVTTFEGHSELVSSIAVCFDGIHAVSGSWDKTIKIWHIASGECVQTLSGHLEWVDAIVMCHDDKLIVSCSWDKSIKVWDRYTGECVFTLTGHTERVTDIVLTSDDSQVISCSKDKSIKVWDMNSGVCLFTLNGHLETVLAVILTINEEYIISASKDMSIKLWNRLTCECCSTLQGHTSHVNAVDKSADGQYIVSGSRDKSIKIWSLSSGQCLATLEGHTHYVRSVAISADDQYIVSASKDKSVKKWEFGDAFFKLISKPVVIEGHTQFVLCIAMSADEKLIVSCSEDKSIQGWNLSSGECLYKLLGHTDAVKTVIINSNNDIIISGSKDKSIKIWDTKVLECVCTLNGHTSAVRSIVWSIDEEHIFSASSDMGIKMWNVVTGECVMTYIGHENDVRGLALCPTNDMEFISASTDETIKIWNIKSGECLFTFEGHDDTVTSLAVSSNGKYIFSGSEDNSIKMWDYAKRDFLKTFRGHTSYVISIVLSPDDLQIISCSADNTIKIFNIFSSVCIATLKGHTGYISSLCVNSKFILSASYDATIKVWSLV